jgi:hypothetical protein
LAQNGYRFSSVSIFQDPIPKSLPWKIKYQLDSRTRHPHYARQLAWKIECVAGIECREEDAANQIVGVKQWTTRLNKRQCGRLPSA